MMPSVGFEPACTGQWRISRVYGQVRRRGWIAAESSACRGNPLIHNPNPGERPETGAVARDPLARQCAVGAGGAPAAVMAPGGPDSIPEVQCALVVCLECQRGIDLRGGFGEPTLIERDHRDRVPRVGTVTPHGQASFRLAE